MLSLGNTYTKEEVVDFYNRVQKGLNDEFEIVCELKYDGTSISLTYINGELAQAITRGDGVQGGDDVTANVRTIRSIPLKLRGNDYHEFEIRGGEILMPWSVFEALNKEREEQEEALFANPRNAGSGTLKQQDPKIVASRKLDSYLYYMLGEHLPTDGHYENLMKAKEWGVLRFRMQQRNVRHWTRYSILLPIGMSNVKICRGYRWHRSESEFVNTAA